MKKLNRKSASSLLLRIPALVSYFHSLFNFSESLPRFKVIKIYCPPLKKGWSKLWRRGHIYLIWFWLAFNQPDKRTGCGVFHLTQTISVFSVNKNDNSYLSSTVRSFWHLTVWFLYKKIKCTFDSRICSWSCKSKIVELIY